MLISELIEHMHRNGIDPTDIKKEYAKMRAYEEESEKQEDNFEGDNLFDLTECNGPDLLFGSLPQEVR